MPDRIHAVKLFRNGPWGVARVHFTAMQSTDAKSRLSLGNDHLIADFPYDAAQVKEVKAIPGASWDKVARVWRIPAASVDQARRFAQRHGFDIDPDVNLFTAPEVAGTMEPGVRLLDDALAIGFDYDPVKVEAVKRIGGVTFNTDLYTWTAPLAGVAEVLHFASMFNLVVEPEVIERQRVNEAIANNLAGMSTAVDADDHLTTEVPLKPYQRAGVVYALAARHCFIADEMGLGKTVQALVALEESDAYPAVVVCPPTLTLNWAAEVNKWVPHRSVSLVSGRKAFPEPADITVVGWSNISAWSSELSGFNSYVFDESHYAKSLGAQRTKAAINIAKGAPGLVLCLTGTPITNRPAEFVSQLQILGRLGEFGGRSTFERRYCGAFKDRFGHWRTDGATHLDELNDRLRSTCYIRRTKDQVLDELPPLLHNRILVTPDPSVMREYRKAEEDIVEFMVARAKELALEMGVSPGSAAVIARIKAEANEHLVRISALRRLAAMAKMGAVTEWVESMLDAGSKVVLAAHHRDVVDALADAWGGLKIQGGMLVQDVEDHKSRFMTEPDAKVITLSIQAGKTGHTLTSAQDIAFVELPFTPADLDQTAARCHRIGQPGVVTAHYLLAAGTIDEKLDQLIQRKRQVVDAATEGGTVEAGFSIGAELVAGFTALGLE